MPEGKVSELEDLPNAIFLDILILVDAAFPPLAEPPGMLVCNGLVRAGRRKGAEAPISTVAALGDVDNILHLRVIEEKAMDWTIAIVDPAAAQAVYIQPLDAGFAAETAAEEFDKCFRMVGEQISNLYECISIE
jgi:hypothetical protein